MRCQAHGSTVTVASMDRLPGALSIAVRGAATALVWQDGPIAKAVVLDERGRPRAAPRALNDAGSLGATPAVFAAGEAFAVTYVHKYGPSLQGCDLVARVLSADGTPGEPVVMARSVCASTGYPVATVAGGAVVAAFATGYEGQGLGIVRWPLSGAPERTASPGRSALTTPHRVAATPDGLAVVWSEDAEAPVYAGLRLDTAARPVGEPWHLPMGEREPPWIVAGRPVWLRVRGGVVELSATDAPRPAPWSEIDAGDRARGARVVTTGGRAWVLAETSSGAHRAVPLAEDGTQAGPAWDLPAAAFAIDGSRGAAAELRSSPREVRWTALDCGTEHRRP